MGVKFAIFSKSKSIGHLKLKKNQDTIDVRVQGNFMSNQLDLIKQLVISGTCLGMLPKVSAFIEIVKQSLDVA